MNRSMEAHHVLKSEGLEVESYGVGSQVKIPGTSANRPNIYPFGTPYRSIYEQLKAENEAAYARIGLIEMLERNMKVKEAPQRWQDTRTFDVDVVITFDDGVFDKLMDDMQRRGQSGARSMLIINMSVVDNHVEAGKAAPLALRLCRDLNESEDWEDDVDDIMDKFSKETGRKPFYTICFV